MPFNALIYLLFTLIISPGSISRSLTKLKGSAMWFSTKHSFSVYTGISLLLWSCLHGQRTLTSEYITCTSHTIEISRLWLSAEASCCLLLYAYSILNSRCPLFSTILSHPASISFPKAVRNVCHSPWLVG